MLALRHSNLKGHLPLEGAAQIVRALGFDHTAVGWAHIDWPALRADPIAEAHRVRRIMEPLGLDIDDSFAWFRNLPDTGHTLDINGGLLMR